MSERQDTITVSYNARCPVCAPEVHHYARMAERQGEPLHLVDASGDEAGRRSMGLDKDEALRRLHVKTEDGRVLAGVDAFAVIWERFPRYRPLARLVRNRRARPVAAFVYDRILAPAIYGFDRWRFPQATDGNGRARAR